MRISTGEASRDSILYINQAYTQYSQAQTEVATGKQIQQPSDNPAGTAQILDFNEQMSQLAQYNSNITQAQGFLSTGEQALSSVTELLNQARTIAVQGSNGTSTSSTQASLADQIQNIISQIGALGNTSYGSQYVFAGQRDTSPPLQGAAGGFTYVGGSATTGDGQISYEVGQNQSITVNVTGDQVFIPVVQALTQLQNDLYSNNEQGISQTDLAQIDTQLNNVSSISADFGSKIDQLTNMQNQNSTTTDNFTQFVSNIQDANLPQAVITLQTAQTAYQAALETSAQSYQFSLLNFLQGV